MPSSHPDQSSPITEVQLPLSFNALATPQEGEPVTLLRRTISTLTPDEVLVRVQWCDRQARKRGPPRVAGGRSGSRQHRKRRMLRRVCCRQRPSR